MLAFLNSAGRGGADPFASVKATTAWLRELPVNDAIGRQQLTLQAFEGMRQSRRPIDLARAEALQHADLTLAADRRGLFRQYVASLDSAPAVAMRIWQASFDLTQAFAVAYQAVLEAALGPKVYGTWKPHVPILFTRLVHYLGTDAKLRICRHERWIPAKWAELHRLYVRASELGVHRMPTSLEASNSAARQWTVEQEYVYTMLLHQLNSGNLTPAQFDWVAAQLRSSCRKLKLTSLPSAIEDFFVDPTGDAGLSRHSGQESGVLLRYLDTTPLAAQLDLTLAGLRQSDGADEGSISPATRERMRILQIACGALAPLADTDLRRDPREACSIPARVRIGLARIHQLCRGQAPTDPEAAVGKVIEVRSPERRTRDKPLGAETRDTLCATLAMVDHTMWHVKDRSVSGLRIITQGEAGRTLALGALVTVRQSDVSKWRLGVVRRINRLSADEVEAGISLIAERFDAITLYAKRPDEADSAVPAGPSGTALGPRIEGLYLPPPSRPHKPIFAKTVIVPNQEYVEGREVILTTPRSIYTVAMHQIVEQRNEWSWVTIKIIDKQPRPRADEERTTVLRG
jgi:cyclic-di-GMP-binding protein